MLRQLLEVFLAAVIGACGATGPVGGLPASQREERTMCPAGETVPGIDVSQYQGTVHFTAVRKAGKRFALIRVSDGAATLDPTFEGNWQQAREAGLLRGAYQYFRAGEDAALQAALVVERVGELRRGDLPAVLDLETLDGESPATVGLKMLVWLAQVKAGTGKAPLVYTNLATWRSLGSPELAGYPLWIAHWEVDCPTVPGSWANWALWQHSSTGRVAGISGPVDLDRFNGSYSELEALAGGTVPPAVPSQLAPAAHAAVRGASVKLTWAPTPQATSYNLKMQYFTDAGWVHYYQWSIATNSFTAWPQIDACTYSWSVQACHHDVCSAWSLPAEFDYDK